MLKDSGDRREFKTGAVRDMHSGKGRCDLLPLDTVAAFLNPTSAEGDAVLFNVNSFIETGDTSYLKKAVSRFCKMAFDGSPQTALLELAIHFEDGAVKYGDNNWRKGIPANVYVDSAIRHYLKWLRLDDDEPHDRATLWNLICCIWTCEHLPELNVYKKTEEPNR